MSDSVRPRRQQPTRLPRPWDSPGKNAGAGCHFLLQCVKVKVRGKSLSRVRLFATPRTAAHQAPPSMGVARGEHWSGVASPSPLLGGHKSPSCLCLFCTFPLSRATHWASSCVCLSHRAVCLQGASTLQRVSELHSFSWLRNIPPCAGPVLSVHAPIRPPTDPPIHPLIHPSITHPPTH